MAAQKKQAVDKFNPAAIIEQSTWKDIQEIILGCTEEQALALLEYEKTHKKRSQWMNRFHQRFNKLRGQREKRELAIL